MKWNLQTSMTVVKEKPRKMQLGLKVIINETKSSDLTPSESILTIRSNLNIEWITLFLLLTRKMLYGFLVWAKITNSQPTPNLCIPSASKSLLNRPFSTWFSLVWMELRGLQWASHCLPSPLSCLLNKPYPS